MKSSHRILVPLCLWATAPALLANTVAYWRFEGSPDTQIDDGATGGNTYEVGTGVLDSSGNGNDLSVWDEGGAGYLYRTDVAGPTTPSTGQTNSTSGQNSGSYPAMWCATTAVQTWSPSAWTIEVAFQPELTDSYRTLVGRDSRTTATVNGDLAALYFQIQPNESLAIKFCDVSGRWHEAISAAGLVQGFTFPNTAAGQWQAAVATCDGTTLSLYYRNVETNGAWQLAAQTDLTASGSPDTRLTAGAGTGGDWTAGNWTVGRGLYAGGHGDRAWGFIDEVRISDTALSQAEFLYTPNTADSDSDGLADSWEQFYFSNLDQIGTGNPDGDAFNNEAEENGGSDPTKILSVPGDIDGDGLADTWETTNFGGIAAQDGSGDPDGDLATNEQEESGASNPNAFQSWPDADTDQMNDAWETKFLGSTGASDGTPDSDGDHFTDREEFLANTNPAASAFSSAFAQGSHRWSFTNSLADSIGGSDAQILPGGSAAPAVLGATSIQLAGGAKAQADYVLLGSHLLRGTSTPVTIEFWVTHNTVQNWSRIFDFHASTAQKLFMSFTRGNEINQDRVEWGGVVGSISDDTNAPYTLLTPFHIALVIQPGKGANGSTRVTWYSAPAGSADLGAAQGTFDTANNLVNLDDLNDALGLSPYPDNVPSATYDEVRIWNGALAAWALEGFHDRGPDNISQPDADADTLPDDWETAYGLGIGSGTGIDGPTGDPDNDLTDNRHELYFGTDPQNPASNAQDTDADGLPDAWEVTHFGTIAAQNATGDPDGDFAYNDEEQAAATDPNSATSFPDSEPDGLGDGWEMVWFGDLSQIGTGDPDGDGFDNLNEQSNKTNPNDPLIPGATDGDGDNDGLDDRWEVLHFTNITSQGATGNPDGDSADNLAEYQGLSNPTNPASTPADVNGDGIPDNVTSLGFSATGSGILDKDGEATGFTQRLANTGTDPTFLPNDPNLDLDTAAGTLAITSTSADVNGQAGMAVAEMLGIPLSSLGYVAGRDFMVRAKFVNLPVFAGADQLGLFAGGASTAVMRGGRINASGTFGTNTNGTNDADGVGPGAFAHLEATRSATVELSRTAGVWAMAINGVDITPAVQPAFLDALSDLTVGVFVSDVQSAGVHKTAYLDSFTAVVMGSASADADGDGLDDAWEIANFGSAGAHNGSGNPDSDSATNLEEFAFDGNPNNGADQGHVVTVRGDSNANGRADLTLTIAVRAGATFAAGPNGTQVATVGGITYTVRGSEDLQAWTSAVTWVGSAASGDPDYELHTFLLEVSDAAPPTAKGFLQAGVTAP